MHFLFLRGDDAHDGATLVRMTERHLVTVHVSGRPSSYSTAYEKLWKDSVRKAFAATGVQPQDGRFAVRPEFWIAASQNVNEVWDLDNLIKPTLDAMEDIFGLRPWKTSAASRRQGRPSRGRQTATSGRRIHWSHHMSQLIRPRSGNFRIR
jgi:hypothetical protein